MTATAFPPLINLHTAGWPNDRVQPVEKVSSVNNEIIARAALARIRLSDHVYGFPAWCDMSASVEQ